MILNSVHEDQYNSILMVLHIMSLAVNCLIKFNSFFSFKCGNSFHKKLVTVSPPSCNCTTHHLTEEGECGISNI